MATIVVGGHSRKVGKTSVVAGLIAAFSRHPWTAVKISSHWHGGASANDDEVHDDAFQIVEERDGAGSTDTSRFLAAGALRSIWVQVGKNGLEIAMQRLHPILQVNPFVIIESNSILRFIQPDLTIMTLRFDVAEFKESAREMLLRADAAVAIGCHSLVAPWQGIPAESLTRIPLFAATDIQTVPPSLVEWIQKRLHL
jgi:hypothetical protein